MSSIAADKLDGMFSLDRIAFPGLKPLSLELAEGECVGLTGDSGCGKTRLLRAVAVGWREASLAENADRLLALGAELHDRTAIVLEHAAGLGSSLEKAVERYNRFVASAPHGPEP